MLRKFYEWLTFRWHRTIDMDPKDVREIGLKGVARIKEAMEKVKNDAKFSGTLPEFFEHMRNNKDFYTDSKENF